MFSKKPKIKTSINHFDSLIAVGTTCYGDMSFNGALKIDGTVEGAVCVANRNGKNENSVIVGANGVIKGSINGVDNVIIAGKVEGDIVAKSVVITSTAELTGKFQIHYDLLQIEPGAKVVGILVQNNPDPKTAKDTSLAAVIEAA